MPPVAMIAVAAFGAISAGAAIAGAIGVTAFLGMSVATWAAIGAVGMLVSGLALAATMPKPKTPESAGQQLNMKLSADNALPVAYGRTATGGSIYYRDTSGRSNKTLAMLVALSVGGAIGGVSEVRANDYQLSLSGGFGGGKQTTIAAIGDTDSKSKMFKKNSLHFWHLNGADPQPQTFAQVSGLPIPADRASGVATAIIQADYDQEVFPQGLPKFTWVVNGQRVYDPRKDSTYPGGSGSHRISNPATWEWSQNPHLCALNWTLGRWSGGKKLFGIGAPPEEVDIPAFVAGANIADALGWTVGGVAQTTDDKFSVLGTLLQAGGAIPLVRGAQISVLTYTVKPSIYTITKDDVIGSASVMNTAPHRDRKNRITPTYREESQFWNLVPGEAVSAAQYVAEDSGEVRSSEINLPFVQKASQAHQLATYDLVNTREFLTFEITAKPKLLAVRVGDCVNVTLPDIAVNNQKCMVVQRDFDPNTFQIKLTLRSETDAKHTFALGQSQVAPPSPSLSTFDPSNPDGPGPNAWTISANSIEVQPTEEQIEAGMTNTVIMPALVVEGANDDPTTAQVIFEWRRPLVWENGVTPPTQEVQAEMGWIGAAEGHKAITRAELANVLPETDYEVSVSYRTVLGIKSPRIILGPITTSGQRVGGVQDGGIDWTSNTIVNVPPILRDLDTLTELQALADAKITDALEDLSNAVADLGNVVVDVDGAVANATADLVIRIGDAEDMAEAARNRADGLWTVVGENDGSGLRATVLALQNSQVGDLTAVTNRVTGLEQVVNATGAQALARQTDLDELEVALDGTYAKATDLSDLTTRVTTAEGVNSAQNTRLNTAETNIAGKASATDLTALTTRVTNAEGTVSSHNTRLNTAESDIAGKASATSVGNLQSEVTGARNGSANLAAQLGTMRQTVSDGLAGKASVTDVTSLTSRVGTAETNITGANTRIDNVVTDLAGKASTSSVTTLANEITGARNGSANLGAQLTTMRQTVTDGLAGKASATAMTNLTTRVGNAETTITSHNGRLDAAESDIAGKASSSSVTTLSNEIVAARNGGTTLKSRIDGLQTSLTDAINLKASAQSVLDLSSEIANARGSGNATLSARFTQVNNTIVDGLAGKASASSVSTLSTKVDGFDSRITTAQSVAASADGKVNAKIGVVLDVNGLVSGYSSVNNGSTSSFNVNANTFNLLTPGNPGDRIELSGTTGFKMYKAGVRRIFFGFQ
ncbi:hypothetical protein ACLBV5_09645 [Brevundimonas sp. M1A4_2e]